MNAKCIMASFLLLITSHSHALTVPAGIPCDDIPGSEKFLTGHKIVMVGEVHGTNEMPATFVRLVCAALRQGNTVSVGLEIWFGERPPLEKYLQSNGDALAKRELLSSIFWKNNRDGRSSVAYADMIDAFRRLRQAGFPLSVAPLMTEPVTAENVHGVDEIMAAWVRREYETQTTGLTMTYTGNVHSMKILPDWMPPTIPEPMGSRLSKFSPVSIKLESSGGSAWNCTPECGKHDMAVQPGHSERPVFVFAPSADSSEISGRIDVGMTSASYPAATN
jgi:hypothetical protein